MKLKSYLKNELFLSSLILLILSNIGNLLNFAFQFILARILNSSDFGSLAFLTNLIFIFGVPALAIQTAISKKTTLLNSQKQYSKIKGLLFYSIKKLFFFSAVIMAVYILLAILFYKKIGINLDLLIISSLMILLSLIYPVIVGVMQGIKKFVLLGWNSVILFFIKFIFGISLALIGFKVYGALIGIIFGTFIAILFGLSIFRKVRLQKEDITFYNTSELLPFSALFILTLMYSIDILIGKFVLVSDLMGGYSRISLLAKIILFASLTIGTVMFPISSEKKLSGANTNKIMLRSLYLTIFICIAGLVLFLFSRQIINILFGADYLKYSFILLPLGLAFSSISLLNLVILYGLAIEKFKKKEFIALACLFILEVLALIVYNSTILQFTLIFTISNVTIFIVLFILSLRWKK